jgi:hypothetical protein
MAKFSVQRSGCQTNIRGKQTQCTVVKYRDVENPPGLQGIRYSIAFSASMLDYFPILHSLPDLLSPSKRRAKELHKEEITLYKSYMLLVKERNEKDIKAKNFCDYIFTQQKKYSFLDDWASYVSGTLLEAGADTTASIFFSFAVAMINFPEVQKEDALPHPHETLFSNNHTAQEKSAVL